MVLDLLTIAAALAASVTGILAVGCGRFGYRRSDLLEGDPLAVAYVWTCCSTVASAFQATAVLDATVRGGGQTGALALAASVACSLLFTVAHTTVGRWADRRNGARAR